MKDIYQSFKFKTYIYVKGNRPTMSSEGKACAGWCGPPVTWQPTVITIPQTVRGRESVNRGFKGKNFPPEL